MSLMRILCCMMVLVTRCCGFFVGCRRQGLLLLWLHERQGVCFRRMMSLTPATTACHEHGWRWLQVRALREWCCSCDRLGLRGTGRAEKDRIRLPLCNLGKLLLGDLFGCVAIGQTAHQAHAAALSLLCNARIEAHVHA